MSQIMRLRRVAGNDHHIVDRNNGERHERAFTSLIRDYGLLHEAELLPRSYGGDSWFGKFHPAAGAGAARARCRSIVRGADARQGDAEAARCSATESRSADLKAVQAIYDKVESQGQTLRAEPLHLGLRGRRRGRGAPRRCRRRATSESESA